MRKLFALLFLAFLAVPAWAGPKQKRTDARHTKFTVSLGTDIAQTTSDLDAARYDFNTGRSFLTALVIGYLDYIGDKRGVQSAILYLDNSDTASVNALATNPGVFAVGDTFRFYGSRTAALREKNRPDVSVEIRPRLARDSRWRAAVGYTKGQVTTFTTDSTTDDVRVDSVTVSPFSAQFTSVDLEMSRNLTTERFTLSRNISVFSFGPEYDIVRTRWLDLSLEAGAALWMQNKTTARDTRTGRYTAFAPEFTVPDTDPRSLVTLGEPQDSTGGIHNGGFAQYYVGARLEVFPLRHLGLGAKMRWYTNERPWDTAYNDPMLGPVQVHTRANHWSASVSLVYAR